MLLHVDVLWKIYDVGGGAGESIALPVARPHMTMSEQLVFNEELAKYVASQTPRYLRQRFYFMKPTIAFFTGTSAVEKYVIGDYEYEAAAAAMCTFVSAVFTTTLPLL